MKVDKSSLALYVVTDRSWLGHEQLEDQVAEIAAAGATFIQLREKSITHSEFVDAAKKIKQVTDRYNIPFVINDNIEVAMEVDADGVHVGQKDMQALSARALLGADKILGVSVQTVDQAIQAERDGADYLGVGAVFATSTKPDASDVSLDTLKEICNAVNIPVVAIGGIQQGNVAQLAGSGVDGVAVISAIFAQKNKTTATKSLLEQVKLIIEQ